MVPWVLPVKTDAGLQPAVTGVSPRHSPRRALPPHSVARSRVASPSGCKQRIRAQAKETACRIR